MTKKLQKLQKSKVDNGWLSLNVFRSIGGENKKWKG